MLSVYRDHGVVPKESRSDNYNKTPEDVSRYLHVREGDLVVNKMKAWSGSLAVSAHEGIVSADYLVCRVAPNVEPRFLHHVLRSKAVIGEMSIRSLGIRPNQERLYWDDLAAITVNVPDMREQRRIADFLDDRVARIDQIITARRQQQALLEAALIRASFDAITGGLGGSRRDSGLSWLGSIPSSWPVLTVATEFQVELGKMLDEKRQRGEAPTPYLRNTNVQWDRVDLSDLKSMDINADERDRYCVAPGDLLICEGGQPGRSAVWRGELAPLGFQKALHRARTRGRSRAEWLLECLRVASHLNVFSVENGQTTIGHLTNEQIRSLRLPFPGGSEQDGLLDQLRGYQQQIRSTAEALVQSVSLLQEYKQSLITAAVTGELDVTTAGSGIPV